MLYKLSSTIFTAILGISMTCGLTASPQAGEKEVKITGQNVTVTGCLKQESAEKNEYRITGEDGKTWGLTSKTVKLGDHLNHKVTVSGKVTKAGHETEAGDVDVSDLKMVSTSCP